jgi:hypothetical protein
MSDGHDPARLGGRGPGKGRIDARAGGIFAWLATLGGSCTTYAIGFVALAVVAFAPLSADVAGGCGHLALAALVCGASLLGLGLPPALRLGWIEAHPSFAMRDLGAAAIACLRRGIRRFAVITFASIARSRYTPRSGTCVCPALPVRAFVPGGLDRLLRPGAATGADHLHGRP